MSVDERVAGRSIDDTVEAEMGSLFHHACLLQELESAAYCVEMEFEYDEQEVAVDLLKVVKQLRFKLERVSLRPDGTLTIYRQCRRCSGSKACGPDEPVCAECNGAGFVTPEFDDLEMEP